MRPIGSWLVFADAAGVGASVVQELRSRGHRVRAVEHRPVDALTEIGDGYLVNPRRPEQMSDC